MDVITISPPKMKIRGIGFLLPKFKFKITSIKVALLVLLVSVNPVSGKEIYAQGITLSLRNVSFERALTEIKKQSKYIVWYEGNLTGLGKKVTLDAKDQSLEDVLKQVFKDQPFTYNIVGKTIVVKKKPVSQQSSVTTALQDFTEVTGKVLLLVKGEAQPFAGVTIQEKGQRRMALSDVNGDFKIRVNKGAILVFSTMGYKTKEIIAGASNHINVTLEEDLQDLSEVVVTGYTVQERREITGAISQIKAKDIENKPLQSFDQAMQGKMAGVLVQSATGIPGGAIKVEIRGQGSITAGTQPLYIVDGIPLNSEDSGTRTSSNPLAFLNPDDIQSIEVLKDAAAASIYGAQAANGVVLVTTKGGEAGATSYTLSYRQGVVEPLPLLNVLNAQQYLEARMEALQNRYPNRTAAQIRSQVLSESQLPIGMTDAEIAALPSYDWQDAVFRTGLSSVINLAATGGSQKTNFRIAGSYNETQGSVIGTDFMRGTASIRLNHEHSKKLTFRTNINLTVLEQNGPIGAQASNTYLSAPHYAAPLTLPFIPIYQEDGSYYVPPGGAAGTFGRNTVQATEYNTVQDKTAGIFANFSVNYNIVKNLSLRSYIGVDYRNITSEYYLDPRTQEGMPRNGALSLSHRVPVSFTTTHTFTYDKTIARHHKFRGLLGVEYRTYGREIRTTSGEGFPTHEFRELQSAAVITAASSSWTGVKRMGTYGQLNYAYKKRFMGSAILRYDGSSRFGTNNMFGWFPAISAGWDIAQEKFISSAKWLQQLKLRAGYGETGNDQIGNFVSRSLYAGGVSYNGQSGIQPSTLGNPDLSWEKNVTINLGLDYSLFNRKLYGSVEVFNRISKDLLLSRPVTWTSGYEEIYRNVGEVENKGLEIELNTDPIRTPKFNWSINYNITFLKNKVTKLYDDVVVLPNAPSVRLGQPLQTNYYVQYAGVNSATGRPMWYDSNGNYTYNPNGVVASVYPRGSRLSDYFGGLTNTFRYKMLELSVFFQYDMGREIYNNLNRILSRGGDGVINGYEWYYLNRWQEPGQITSVPRSVDASAEINAEAANAASSRFLEDASYIRLKQVNLSYNLPAKLRNRLKVGEASVFLQAMNLHTWTKWTGYDPEFYIDDSNFTSNAGVIPQTRSYSLGVQVKF